MHGITPSSDWTTLLAGFIVGGIGVGTVNAPLASAAVSVVEPRQAGMASGINNTFRQVGIATGIAALGAILQAKGNFIDGLNAILLVAAFVAFAGGVVAFALVRTSDFVRPQAQAGAA
jgi:predicted MFS family arabinose efflux permease